jgi:hypothetical protein
MPHSMFYNFRTKIDNKDLYYDRSKKSHYYIICNHEDDVRGVCVSVCDNNYKLYYDRSKKCFFYKKGEDS